MRSCKHFSESCLKAPDTFLSLLHQFLLCRELLSSLCSKSWFFKVFIENTPKLKCRDLKTVEETLSLFLFLPIFGIFSIFNGLFSCFSCLNASSFLLETCKILLTVQRLYKVSYLLLLKRIFLDSFYLNFLQWSFQVWR